MSKFPVEKKLDLSFLGGNWTGAELVLSGLTFAQTKDLTDVNTDATGSEAAKANAEFVVKFLGDHFLRGKAWNGSTLVELTKDDLGDLPVEVVNKAVELLAGTPDPKS